MDLPVTITNKAFREIHKIINTKSIPEHYGLRIGIKGAGCAGVSFMLGFDTASTNDGTFEVDGLQIYIAKKHTMYLMGLTLDFYEGSDSRGFIFSHPDHPDATG